MKPILASAAALLLLLATASDARAAGVSLGSASLTSVVTNQLNGNSADRSGTASTSGTTIRAQASADHGLTTNPDAIVDITVNAVIPYTVTRTVTISNPPGGNNASASFETFSLNFTFNYDHNTAHSAPTGGGLQNAQAFAASVSSQNGLFSGVSWGGSFSGGGGTETGGSLNQTQGRSYTVTLNFSGPGIGEVGPGDSLPSDFRSWNDTFVPIHPFDKVNGNTLVQTISDTLVISFRLRAESRPSGSVSTTGGEAIACAGQASPLGGFDLDDGLDCGAGFTTSSFISGLGSAVVALPEPALLGLLAGGGLLLLRRRRG